MKKQFLSVLAFTAILLSSCGGTAKIEKASACGQEGEITASSATAIAETESGKVAGYVEMVSIYIKVSHMPKPNVLCRPWPLINGKRPQQPCLWPYLSARQAHDGTATSRRLPSTGMTVILTRIVCG